MTKDPFDFKNWIEDSFNDASREIIKKALKTLEKIAKTAKNIGQHSFYITFSTNNSDVVLSDFLKTNYPDKMTIVLEKQFDCLIVNNNGFSVDLYFSGTLEKIFIPFSAISNFSDFHSNLNLEISHKKTNPKNKKILKNNSNVIKFDTNL